MDAANTLASLVPATSKDSCIDPGNNDNKNTAMIGETQEGTIPTPVAKFHDHQQRATHGEGGAFTAMLVNKQVFSSSHHQFSHSDQQHRNARTDEILDASKVKKFPMKLMIVLSMQEYKHIISWTPEGDKFTIHNSKLLINEIFPKYFKQCKFPSFLRKLYRWGFVKRPDRFNGQKVDASTYFHPKFRKDKFEACNTMSCKSGAGSAAEAMHDYGQSGVVAGIPVASGHPSASFGFMPPHGYMPPMSRNPAAGGYSYPQASGQYPRSSANDFYKSHANGSMDNGSMPMVANDGFYYPSSYYQHQYPYQQGGMMMNNYQSYSSGSNNGHHPGMRMDSTSAGLNGSSRHGSFNEQNDWPVPFSGSRHVSFDQSARNGNLPGVPRNEKIVTQEQGHTTTVGINHAEE